LNVLQLVIEDHTQNEPIRLEDRLVDFEGLDCRDVAEQVDTPAAPLELEVVEPRQNSSGKCRVAEQADLVMVEAIRQPLKASSKKSAPYY
jgi:hypothetical protein